MSPKLRKALRGGFGYRVQKEAWDATYADWRWCVRRINRLNRSRWKAEDHERFEPLRARITGDPVFGRCWYQLLMQSLYRSCPALGGWFPR